MLNEVKYDGRHYGIPVTVLPFVLAVNRGILDAHGLEVPEPGTTSAPWARC